MDGMVLVYRGRSWLGWYLKMITFKTFLFPHEKQNRWDVFEDNSNYQHIKTVIPKIHQTFLKSINFSQKNNWQKKQSKNSKTSHTILKFANKIKTLQIWKTLSKNIQILTHGQVDCVYFQQIGLPSVPQCRSYELKWTMGIWNKNIIIILVFEIFVETGPEYCIDFRKSQIEIMFRKLNGVW